jgi:nitrate/nitrite transport system permease protein
MSDKQPAPRILDDSQLSSGEGEVRGRERARAIVMPVLGVLGFCAVWQIWAQRPGAVLPGPFKTLQDSWNLIAHPFFDNGPNDKGLGLHILASLGRVALGYSLAALVGVGLGLLVGLSKSAQRALDPIFQVLRTIPPLAWLPIALATFVQAQPSAIFVIFITAVWPIIINTAVGVTRIPEDYRRVAAVYQLKGWRYFWLVLLPAAAPYIFTGLRISIGMAWLAIVAAEMLTGGVGIGFFIWDSYNSSHMSDIIVAVAYVGAVGFALDRLMAFVAAKVGARAEA